MQMLRKELKCFLSEMFAGQGRAERQTALGHYVTGLLLDGERKSVQPMAARLVNDATEADAMRQRLQDCVAASQWSELELQRRLATKVASELEGVEVLVIDDTGFAKKGIHSVGVARQYSGTFGGTDNGQVATSVHLAGDDHRKARRLGRAERDRFGANASLPGRRRERSGCYSTS